MAKESTSALHEKTADDSLLIIILEKCMSLLSNTYAQTMPDWITAKYCDPEKERTRLLTHDCQQTKLREMRAMYNIKVVDCLEMPLENLQRIVSALRYILDKGLSYHSLLLGAINKVCPSNFAKFVIFFSDLES